MLISPTAVLIKERGIAKGDTMRKWLRKLTRAEIEHLKETTEPVTMASFWRNREWHKKENVTCFECESIERKLKEHFKK